MKKSTLTLGIILAISIIPGLRRESAAITPDLSDTTAFLDELVNERIFIQDTTKTNFGYCHDTEFVINHAWLGNYYYTLGPISFQSYLLQNGKTYIVDHGDSDTCTEDTYHLETTVEKIQYSHKQINYKGLCSDNIITGSSSDTYDFIKTEDGFEMKRNLNSNSTPDVEIAHCFYKRGNR